MTGNIRKTLRLRLDEIETDPQDGCRPQRQIDPEKVRRLASSIQEVGLQHPPTVWRNPKTGLASHPYELLSGLNRIEAVKSLGQSEIDVVEFEGDELDARLWAVSENLHRDELTVLERAEHTAEWLRLTEEKRRRERDSAQVETKPQGGRPEGGTRAAAQDIRVDKNEAQRAAKIASIAPKAKTAARDAGFGDNQTALLAIAKAGNDAETQLAKVDELVQRRKDSKARRKTRQKDTADTGAGSGTPQPQPSDGPSHEGLMEVWSKALPADRRKFLHDIRQSHEMEELLDEVLEEREATASFSDDTDALRRAPINTTTTAPMGVDVHDEGRHGTA